MGVNQHLNAIFGFASHRLRGHFALSGGSWESTYPLNNALNKEYARVARATDLNTSSLKIIGTSTALRQVGAIHLAAHNLGLQGKLQFRGFSDTARTSLVYDSGQQLLWPAVYNLNRSWYSPNIWTGQYAETETAGQIPTRTLLLEDSPRIKAFELDFSDPSHPSGSLPQLGMLEICETWQVSVNYDYGSQYGYRFHSEISQLEGGLVRGNKLAPSYVFEGKIPYLPQSETRNKAMEMFRQHDELEPVLWIPNPADETTWLKESKMVRLVKPGLFGIAAYGRHSVPLRLEEYRG